MLLTSLKIERQRFGEHKGQCLGEIVFENEGGKVSVNLTPERCNQLFAVVADGIIDTASIAAKELRCNVIEHAERLGVESDI